MLFLAPTAVRGGDLPQALATAQLRAASIGIEVAQVQADGTLRTVYTYDAGRALMPASTLKLVATATALRLCGAEAVVETRVGWQGTVDEAGVLHGDVVIRGGGDATLASRYDARPTTTFVTEAARALRRAGVRRVEGRVVGDGSLWGDVGVSPDWTWEDLGNYYAAGLYGLNYGANTYRLVLDTSRPGARPAVVRTDPVLPGLTFDNRLSAESYAFDSAYIYGAPHDHSRRLEGAVPHRGATFTLQGDVPDPPLLAAQALRAALEEAGIGVAGAAVSDYELRQVGQEPPRLDTTSYTYRSAPLRDVARQTNVHSQNLLAEMLLRLAAGRLSAPVTTYADAAGAVRDYWRRQGLDATGVRMYDGCGLSPNDRVTAHFLVQLLGRMHADAAFVATLPQVGSEGTVRGFAAGTRLVGRARLKSGTTKQVVAYAGYVAGAEGRTYVVACLVNNYDGRAADVRRQVASALEQLVFE
jgi:D-alanyl-D-alanine carboxypeptidase/D-alanyl-D-alanine-endopeptidase (penicillin-binding protein 4)